MNRFELFIHPNKSAETNAHFLETSQLNNSSSRVEKLALICKSRKSQNTFYPNQEKKKKNFLCVQDKKYMHINLLNCLF